MVSRPTPLGTSHFTLNASGLASLLGGSETIFSLALLSVYPRRMSFGGWYNSPGSYFLGMRLARLATKNPILKAISESDEDVLSKSKKKLEKNIDPAELFEWDGLKGPTFRGIYSGTIIDHTGHFAALFFKECADLKVATTISGTEETSPVDLIIANLQNTPDKSAPLEKLRIGNDAIAFTLIIIVISVAAAAGSGYIHDWYCFSVIVLGILVNGVTHIVIGFGTLKFIHPPPTDKEMPDGDGFLIGAEQIVWLKGKEAAVNPVTRGKFTLHFDNDLLIHAIGICSMLLFLQSIAQFILIPQGSLLGQIMFSGSIIISWGYNLWRSYFNKNREKIQRAMVVESILQTPKLTKYTFNTRTSLAVFVAIANEDKSKSRAILNHILPNDTVEWNTWKYAIESRLQNGQRLQFEESDWNGSGLKQMLYKDAQSAYEAYRKCKEVPNYPPRAR